MTLTDIPVFDSTAKTIVKLIIRNTYICTISIREGKLKGLKSDKHKIVRSALRLVPYDSLALEFDKME